MEENLNRTVWPVMLTPFQDNGAVDYEGLRALIAWYEESGVDGLFAVCQSSEMFCLTLKERVEVAAFVKKHASVPVIASGHISFAPGEQLEELNRMLETGIDALILLTNRFAQEGEGEAIWNANLAALLGKLDTSVPLGLYECPYPYKHLLTKEQLAFCAGTGRFHFLKDTCCCLEMLQTRIVSLAGTPLRLYNANTTTLLDSLKAGAAGFSGVMANFHPELYVWLMRNWREKPREAERVQAALTMCSMIERQWYPVNAKYHLVRAGVLTSTYTRTKSDRMLTPLFEDEVRQMDRLVAWVKREIGI